MIDFLSGYFFFFVNERFFRPNLSTNPSQQSEVIGRNFSAFNLGLIGAEDNTNSIRKAASFIHGTSLGLGRKPSNSSLLHLTPSFHIGGGILPPSVIPSTHEEHSGGLSFNVNNSNSLAVKQNTDIQHSASMGGGLFNNSNNDNNPNRVPGGMVPNSSSESLNSANHKVWYQLVTMIILFFRLVLWVYLEEDFLPNH